MGNGNCLGTGRAAERLPVAQHGIQDREELTHAGDESHLLEFATFQQVLVLRLDQRVTPSGDERGHVEHAAHISTPPFGLAVASFLATVVVHGSYANESSNSLPIHLAEGVR